MARLKKTGNIDSRRITIDGIGGWPQVPAVLIPGNLQAYGIYDDFFEECNLAAGRTLDGWRLRATNALFTIADVVGGVFMLNTSDTADNDVAQLTLGGEDGGAFWPAAHHDIFFEVRVRQTILGVNTLNLAFGLQDPAAAEYLGDDGGGPTTDNHIMFLTLDTAAGNNAWSFESDKAGTADRNALTLNLDALTWHTYGFWVRGVTNIYVFYDRVYYADGLIATDEIPVTGLMPFFCIKDGNGAALDEYIQVDYIMCVQIR